MMPEALIKFGLLEAIEDYCHSINEAGKVKMKFTPLGLQQPLEQTMQTAIYRVIQELCNNAIQHANAQSVFVQLAKHERGITLTVEDDGKGFDITKLEKVKGAGLQNVQSRVDYIKGTFEIQSTPQQGTSINIEIPL